MSQRNRDEIIPRVYSSQAYELIRDYYGLQQAERSGEFLMKHINDGIELLFAWGITDPTTIDAFCLHPMVQNFQEVPNGPAKDLAKEYASIAAKYLCVPETDWIETPAQLYEKLGSMSTPCTYLLLADKVQNQADFRKHHLMSHDRRAELEAYFNLWIKTLLSLYIN